MILQYLRFAIRSLTHNKSYSIINISGLATGIAACLLIGLYIVNEQRFDSNIPDRANVYRLNEYMHYAGTTPQIAAAMGLPIAPMLKADHPEIVSYTRVFPATPIVYPDVTLEYAGKKIKPRAIACADTSFGAMFGVHILEGRGSDFIRDHHSIVLTQTLARRLFGNEPAVNRIINLRVDDTTAYPTVVSNVIADFPATSHLQLDGVLPIPAEFQQGYLKDNYGILIGPTYVRLRPHADVAAIDQAFTKTINTKNKGIDIRLQPVSEVHTMSTDINFDFFNSNKIDGKYIRIFAIIALSIFVIACFNFVNLTIATAAWRGKEIAVKKIMGAGRPRIITQVLAETFLASLIALVLAILLASIFLPALNGLLDRHLHIAALYQPYAFTAYAGVLTLTTFLAGGYPALLISSSRIGQALKTKVLFPGSRTILRNVLVTGQFAIAVVFVVSLIVFLKQLHFLQNKDLGYSYDQIVNVQLDNATQTKIQGLRSDLARIDGVLGTAYGWTPLGSGGALMGIDYSNRAGELSHMSVNYENASPDFLQLFDMKIVGGKNFSKDPQNEYLVNETMARLLGYADPIGKPINLTSFPNGHIVGIVKDYNYSSLRSKIEPLLIGANPYVPGWKDQLYIKVSTANIGATMKQVSTTLAAATGDASPEWQFLDEHFRELYRSEQQASTIIAIIGSLSIAIACLGLFGLAAFVIAHRSKEISIRKVLGASVTGITLQISTGFLRWVALAFVIAAPVTWWFTNNWLNNFAYRISVQPWMFAAGAAVAVGTALVTVGILALKAAGTNPVTNLRSE